MEHVFSGIMKVWAKFLTSIMGIFTSEFWENFRIFELQDDLLTAKTLFKTNANSLTVIDKYFPGLHACTTIFIWMGIFISVMLVLIGLVRAMLPQDFSSDVEHPARVVTRFAMGFCGALWAYKIMALITSPMSAMFTSIYDLGNNKGTSADFQMGIAANGKNEGENDFNFDLGLLESSGTFIKDADFSDIGMFFLVLVFMTLMCIQYIKLVVELIERWLTLCVLIYTSPLAMSTLSSGSTTGIFKSYMKMIFAEYLVIMFNFIFVYIFCAGYVKNMTIPDTGYIFENITDACVFFMLMSAWCMLGQKLDEHLNSLGITAARTGAGIGQQLAGAAGTTLATARMAMSAGKTIGRGAKSAKDAGGKVMGKVSDAKQASLAKEMGLSSPNAFGDALNKRGGLAKPSGNEMGIAKAAGFNTAGLKNVSMGDGRLQGTTNSGSQFTSIPMQNGQVPKVAGITQSAGGQQMFTPFSGQEMLKDDYFQNQLKPGTFGGGYTIMNSGENQFLGGNAAHMVVDDNGVISLALNNGIYDTTGGDSISAQSGGSWSRFSLKSTDINAALNEAKTIESSRMKPMLDK